MKKDNATSNYPKINIKFIYTKGGQIELESVAKYNYPKYFCKDFYYIKNFTEPLPKEELDKINEILNKSVAISESEMRKLIKNTTEKVNKTKEEKKDKKEEKEEKEEKKDKKEEKEEKEEKKDNDTNINDTDKNSTSGNNTKKDKNKKKKDKKKKEIKKEEPVPSNYTYNNTLYITTTEKTRLNNLKKIGHRKDEENQINLKIKETFLLYPKPMNETQIKNSVNKIKRLIEVDTNRTKLIEKRNKLEALIFEREQYLEKLREKSLKRNITLKSIKSLYREVLALCDYKLELINEIKYILQNEFVEKLNPIIDNAE